MEVRVYVFTYRIVGKEGALRVLRRTMIMTKGLYGLHIAFNSYAQIYLLMLSSSRVCGIFHLPHSPYSKVSSIPPFPIYYIEETPFPKNDSVRLESLGPSPFLLLNSEDAENRK